MWVYFFGESAAQNQVSAALEELVGPQTAHFVEGVIANAAKPSSLSLASIVTIGAMLFGASGLFAQLQDALNTIWKVEPKSSGIVFMIKQRLFLFMMIFSIGVVLIVSFFASVIVSGAIFYLDSLGTQGLEMIGQISPTLGTLTGYVNLGKLLQTLNNLVSFGIITLMFALIYKLLPDAEIAWNDVWIGAAVTSLLFTLGKYLIGLYLGSISVGSAYGAAGSLIVLLVWVYYSAQVFLLGAEFTQVYSRRFGSRIVSKKTVKET